MWTEVPTSLLTVLLFLGYWIREFSSLSIIAFPICRGHVISLQIVITKRAIRHLNDVSTRTWKKCTNHKKQQSTSEHRSNNYCKLFHKANIGQFGSWQWAVGSWQWQWAVGSGKGQWQLAVAVGSGQRREVMWRANEGHSRGGGGVGSFVTKITAV